MFYLYLCKWLLVNFFVIFVLYLIFQNTNASALLAQRSYRRYQHIGHNLEGLLYVEGKFGAGHSVENDTSASRGDYQSISLDRNATIRKCCLIEYLYVYIDF